MITVVATSDLRNNEYTGGKPNPPMGSGSGSKSNTGAIIGGAVGGGVGALAILGLLIWCCVRRRRRRGAAKNDTK